MQVEHERLGEDDLAALRDGQFTASAIAAQLARGAVRQSTPGRCLNCAAQILPPSIYCDDDCREDHEAREKIARRKGRR
jgi:hypothetical protein